MQYIKLGEVISSAKVDRCGDNDYPVLSITKSEGLMLQSDKFKKRIASNDTNQYKVVKKGQLVQGIHIDEANFGIQSLVEEGIVSPAYKIWDVNTEMIVPKYLEILLRSPRSIRYYSSKFNGSIKRRERITDNDFLSMVIPCPSMTEQQYAVDIVEKVRKLILLRKTEIEKHDELIKARFVEMFIDKGYPQKKVHDVLETAFWLMPATPEFVIDGEVPYITSKNIKNRKIDFENVKYISKESFFNISSNRPTQIGDILVSMIGTLGQTAVITDDRLFYGQNLYLLRLDNSIIDTDYFCEFFNSDLTQHELQGQRNQSTQAYLKANHVEGLSIPMPPLAKQKQFAAFVQQVDKSKVAVQKALDEAQLLFDSLMQNYFG